MAKRDYYEVLGLGREADDAEIKKAYRKIAFENHPDRNAGDKQSESRFKEATEAYEVLRDPKRRADYDRFGHAGVRSGPGGVDVSGFDLADALRAFMRDFGGDLGGFEELFGGGDRRQVATAGEDLQVHLSLTLEEIASGVEKKIRVKHLRSCSECQGRGGSGEAVCSQCGGRGQVRRVQQSFFGQFVTVSSCGRCAGSGKNLREVCKACKGDGRTPQTETLAVRVPAGVRQGNFIPLRGMGDAGIRGGTSGDLVVWIEEKRHAVFERTGDDLRLDLPTSFVTLALGGKVQVPTLGEEVVEVDVAAGTPGGRVLRVRGHGLPSLGGGKGDLLARLVVWIPSRLGASERRLLEELGRSATLRPPRPGKSVGERLRDAFTG